MSVVISVGLPVTLALKTGFKGTEKMVQWLSVPVVLEEDHSSVPNAHVRSLSTTYSLLSAPRDPKTFVASIYSCTHKTIHTHIHPSQKISQKKVIHSICLYVYTHANVYVNSLVLHELEFYI